MKINSFVAINVHGYLNYNIEFFPELTFLIGINGSGKTSALKLILGLTSPSYEYLNQIDFEYAELICSSNQNEKDIIITATHNKKEETFSLSFKSPEINSEAQEIPRFKRPEDDNYDVEEISLREQRNKELFDSLEVTKGIRELVTPKFLGLDRKIYEGKSIDTRFRNRRIYSSHKNKRKFYDGYANSTAIDSSLEDVQFLIFEYFRKIAQEQPKYSEEFKQKIFQLSFKFTDDHNIESVPDNSKALLETKRKVLTAIKSLDIGISEYYVSSFFDKMEDIITKYFEIQQKLITASGKEEKRLHDDSFKYLIKWVNNSSQLKRISEIITYSEAYKTNIADLRAPIKRLESITLDFLKEGLKSLQIADDGEIKVKLNNGKLASVYELSSGEKQIIIMIAHLIFEEDQKPSGVFIIDEPELSLHIAWQEIFINSITAASPKTQFILATHSPSIISKVNREKFCQDLNKLNS